MRMVDLIRAQQKGKKATPEPAKPAPVKAEPEQEPESGEEAASPPKEDWRKAAQAMVSPPPEEPSIFAPRHTSHDKLYTAAHDCLRTIFSAASRREPFAIEPAAEIAERLARAAAKENLQRAPNDSFVRFETLMLQTLGNNSEKGSLTRQALNVAIYALELGDVLGYPLTKLTELALAGMVYDIGKTWLPEAILSAPGPLSERDRALIQAHPLHSYEILHHFGPNWEWLAEVALQHHEREDGTGYPKGLKGDQIHEYAKIIGICDIYEAMAHDRPDRTALTPFDTVRGILQAERGHFSKAILRTFINGMSSYPVGSWVRLSTKEIGRVIATSTRNPLRPILEVWFDASGAKLPQLRLLDLNKEILVHIIGPAPEEAPTG